MVLRCSTMFREAGGHRHMRQRFGHGTRLGRGAVAVVFLWNFLGNLNGVVANGAEGGRQFFWSIVSHDEWIRARAAWMQRRRFAAGFPNAADVII
jgi:hypothetical protein